MIGYKIKDGFIDLAKVDFKCPHCKKEYNDIDDKYLNRCNKNKSGITRIKCECNNIFYITYDYMSNAVAFTIQKSKEIKIKLK